MFAAATGAAPAAVDDPTMRCLLVSALITQNKDPAIAQAGLMSTLYWMGRVNGEMPHADIEKQMRALAPKTDAAQTQADATRCGAEMKVRGEEMERVGKALQQQPTGQPAK